MLIMHLCTIVSPVTSTHYCWCAVAFRIYDLDETGDIQPGELKRLLVALLHNNPDIALDDAVIKQLVDQVLYLHR